MSAVRNSAKPDDQMLAFWRTAKINKTVNHIQNHAHQQRAIQGPRPKKQSGPFDAPSRLRV